MARLRELTIECSTYPGQAAHYRERHLATSIIESNEVFPDGLIELHFVCLVCGDVHSVKLPINKKWDE